MYSSFSLAFHTTFWKNLGFFFCYCNVSNQNFSNIINILFLFFSYNVSSWAWNITVCCISSVVPPYLLPLPTLICNQDVDNHKLHHCNQNSAFSLSCASGTLIRTLGKEKREVRYLFPGSLKSPGLTFLKGKITVTLREVD